MDPDERSLSANPSRADKSEYSLDAFELPGDVVRSVSENVRMARYTLDTRYGSLYCSE